MVSLYYAQPDKIYMDRAISYGELALTLCGSVHQDFFRISERLAYVHRGHAWLFQNLESLDQSIALSRTALLDASPRWILPLASGLISTLQLRFMKLGHQEDLDEAVRSVDMLSKDTLLNDADWPQLHHCISSMMFLQFMTTGIPEHIEAAAHAADLACSLVTVVGSTPHLWTLHQSAICRGEQYNAFGDAAHLNKSIEMLEYVMELAPPESMNWRVAARYILEGLHGRYKATGDMVDLERAIALLPVLEATRNKKDITTTFELKDAGDVLLSHYSAKGALADLEQATKHHREAVQNCTGYNRYEAACTYSATLRVRYETLHEKECAAEGLELQNQAYNGLPDVDPHRAGVLCGLSRWKLCTSLEHSDVGEALDHLLAAPAYRRLKDVSDVLSYLATRNARLSHENASKLSFVYATAIALLPQVASFGLEPRVRLAVISDAGHLTAQGAVHAIANERLDLALEMLEAGRNVFWTQGLHLRTPFADLPDSVRDLLTKITYALARPFPDDLEGAKKDRELARRRRLGDDFRSALAEARQVPGCEDILLNASFKSLVQAARHLMVVIVASESSGYAIVIRDAQCHLVTLAQATTSALQALSLRIGEHTRTVRSSRGMRLVNTVRRDATAAYRELWTLVMHPIVIALQLAVSAASESLDTGLTHSLKKAQGRQRQRLTLCPTGIFMQLPLHAAGVYTGKNQVCCSDYFVSSYTPSIAALLHAQKSLQPVHRSDATTLLVAVHQPLQGTALPMTRKEADVVQKHVSMSSEVIQASTCNEVLEHIQAASIVHLACHGTQNPSDALQSGFHLEDGLLSVSKLMELQLPRAFLAVLGACETAKGDATQPDQAIHLAAAMLFAGFKSVVATMW
jgi:hypothetical protein